MLLELVVGLVLGLFVLVPGALFIAKEYGIFWVVGAIMLATIIFVVVSTNKRCDKEKQKLN